MILRSLSLPAAVRLKQLNGPNDPATPMTFAQSGLDFVGVYLKLARGYFYNWNPDCKLTMEAAVSLSQHVFNVILLSSLVETLMEGRAKGIIEFDPENEKYASLSIGKLLGVGEEIVGFPALLNFLQSEQRNVGDYVGQLRINAVRPEYKGRYTYIHGFLDECCKIIQGHIPAIRNTRVYFLLDEYENLATFQQTIINTLAKLRPLHLSLKIATRPLGVKSLRDLQGEPIQQPRDYEIVDLDYKITDKSYRALLLDISSKRLQAAGCPNTHLDQILAVPIKYAPQSDATVLDEIAKILSTRSIERSSVDEDKWREYIHRLDEAVTYRLGFQSNLRRPRIFGGFDDFTSLSSGIVSNFLELCKLTFYIAETNAINFRGGGVINTDIQCEAIEITSKASLDWISNNIEDNGPKLSRLVLDLADSIREKLLTSFSEPESGRVVITDPQRLEDPEFKQLKALLIDGLRWSVFQSENESGSYFPRHKGEARSVDFWLNRLLAPVLKISHRPRWRMEFKVQELAAIMDRTYVPKSKSRRGNKPKDLPLLEGQSDDTEE